MDREQARVQEGLNRMRRRLDAWFEIQQLYMPGVVILHTEWNKEQLAAAAEQAATEAAVLTSMVDEQPQTARKG